MPFWWEWNVAWFGGWSVIWNFRCAASTGAVALVVGTD
jgi:hypothetical protein